MITGIAIENFKGIRDRVELKLRPITLLFGANSAGKSTVLHALHYAREIFERHNLDADRTIVGGKYIDLGGYQRLVHRKTDEGSASEDFPIRLRIDVDLADEGLTSFYADIDQLIEKTVSISNAIEMISSTPTLTTSNRFSTTALTVYFTKYIQRLLRLKSDGAQRTTARTYPRRPSS